MRIGKQRVVIPILPVKPGQLYPNQGSWVAPFLKPVIEQFQEMCSNIDKAHIQHVGKSQMKLEEDPWDNYLYFDSKYILPLICHSQDLTITEQVLLALFLNHQVSEQTISQFSLKSADLVKELIKFTKSNPEDDDEDLIGRLEHACSNPTDSQTTNEIFKSCERVFKMFYLAMQM